MYSFTTKPGNLLLQKIADSIKNVQVNLIALFALLAFCQNATAQCPGNITKVAETGTCSAYVLLPTPLPPGNCGGTASSPELVISGNFENGPTNWEDCGNLSEVHTSLTDYVYGADINSTNHATEIDHGNSPAPGNPFIPHTLCQTISGFTIGETYQLTFLASRRIDNSGWNIQIAEEVGAVVTIGNFQTTVTRTNTTFGYTLETFNFVANATTLQLKMIPSYAFPIPPIDQSYGLIVDDISIKKVTNCTVINTTANSGYFSVGTTPVIYTFDNGNGGTVNCTFNVIVVDNQNPTITCPADVIVNANTSTGATNVNIGNPLFGDNCPGAMVSNNHPSTTYPIGETTVTWAVTDASDNVTICTQKVTVNNIATTITCPPALTIEANNCTSATGVVLGTPTISGNCNAVPTITNNAPAAFLIGQTTVIWTVSDGCGNTATCTQLITVTGFSVNLGPDKSLCQGPVTLTAATTGGVITGPPPSTPFTEVSGSTADMRIFSGNIDHITLGNTFSLSEDRTNCGQNASASKTLTIPSGSIVKKAYLYWSGSGSLDNQVKLNGTSVTAEASKTVSRSGGFYYFAARKDVTNLVAASGTYTVTDLVWNSGSPYCYDNSAYGAWAMTVIFEKASLPSARIHVNTEKFTFTYPAATYSTTINNISVPAGCNADAKLTIVAFEGDNYKTEKFRIAGVLDPGNNNFRGQSGPNLDIVTKNAPSVVGGTTSLTYSIESYVQNTVFGNAIEGLFDYVKVLKYNNCTASCNGLKYLWNTGATTQSISNCTPGTYNVIVTDCSGCVVKDTVVVTACPPVLPENCYKIVARHSGKVLTIKGNSTSNGADAEQRSYDGSANQIWKFEEVQTGFYKLSNVNSGLALEVTDGSSSDGKVIQQNVFTGAAFQLWSLTASGSYFSIKAKHSNKAVYVKSGSTSNGAVVEQRGSGTNTCEQWSIVAVDCPGEAPRGNFMVTDDEKANEEVLNLEATEKVKVPTTFEVNIQAPAKVKDEFKVNVYPNPAGYEFTIMVNSISNELVTVRILDMNGTVRSVTALAAKSNTIKVGKDRRWLARMTVLH